jgi:hypothetical protein
MRKGYGGRTRTDYRVPCIVFNANIDSLLCYTLERPRVILCFDELSRDSTAKRQIELP